MADDDKAKPKPKKRRVKNPETFRERALKANESAGAPSKKARRGRLSKGLAAVGRGLSGFRPLRPLFKVLGLIGKVIIPPYVRNSWKELKLVTWPSWKESRRLTYAVLIFAVAFGAVIALVDYGLDKVFKHILLK